MRGELLGIVTHCKQTHYDSEVRSYLGLHRTSFLIDEKGIIRKIWLKPKSKIHAEEVLEEWLKLKK